MKTQKEVVDKDIDLSCLPFVPSERLREYLIQKRNSLIWNLIDSFRNLEKLSVNDSEEIKSK